MKKLFIEKIKNFNEFDIDKKRVLQLHFKTF